MVRISIVYTGVQEVAALRIIAAVKGFGVRTQPTVHLRIHGMGSYVQSVSPVGHAAARRCLVGVVFLLHLRLRAVVAAGDQRGSRSVAVERGIDGAVRGEGGDGQGLQQSDSCRRPLEIIQLRARAMHSQRVRLSSHVLQGRELTQSETGVEHQSHACAHLVFPYDGILHDAHFLHLYIVRIGIVAPAVAVGQKGLSGILRPRESRLHVVAVAELIAQRVTIAIAQISVPVAPPFIKGHPCGGRELVFAVFGNGAPLRERLLLPRHLTHIGEERHQCQLRVVKRPNHAQLAHRPHRCVAV